MRTDSRILIQDIGKYINDFRVDPHLFKANRKCFQPFRTKGGISITEHDFRALCEWDRNHFRIEELIKEVAEKTGISVEDFCKTKQQYLKKYGKNTDWHTLFYFHSSNYFVKTEDHEQAVTQVLGILLERDSAPSIISINDYQNIDSKKIEEHVKPINRPKRGNKYVNKTEVEEIIKKENQYISTSKIIKKYIAETGLELAANTDKNFKVYLKKNNFFDLTHKDGSQTVQYHKTEILFSSEDIDKVQERSLIFFINHTKGTEENYKCAKRIFANKYPITCRMLIENTHDGYSYDYPYCTKMILFLNKYLRKEITDLEYDEKIDVLKKIGECSIGIEKSCESFFKYAQEKYPSEFQSLDKAVLGRKFTSATGEKRPYEYDSYVYMAGLVYSDRFMEKNHIVEKMLQSRKYANIVLNMQMHFVSLWRQEDYCAMGPVDLPENQSIEELIKCVSTNGFSDNNKIVSDIIFTFEMEANKRRALKTDELLHLYIPKNAFSKIATSLVINEFHRQKADSDVLIDRTNLTNKASYIELFGEKVFDEVFGGKPFSNRRANHSYADKLSMIIEGKCSPDKTYIAYILVGFARSHKGVLASLSSVTSAYLSAKTNGIPLNLFITEVFARGYCGFTLYMLLSMVIPNFNLLGITEQTEIMKKVGLGPSQIENISDRILKCANEKDKFIKELFGLKLTGEELEKKIKELVENIITENCRISEDYICLKKAAENKDPSCNHKCTYCKFGLLNRYCVYSLIKTYEFYDNAANIVKNPNKALLYRSLNRGLIVPAIKSFKEELETTQEFYSDSFERLVIKIDEKSRIEDLKERERRILTKT